MVSNISLNVFLKQSLVKLNKDEPKFYQVLDVGVTASQPTRIISHRAIDLMFVFDKSRSMRGQKLADAKAAALKVLDKELPPGSSVAVVTFGTEVRNLVRRKVLESEKDLAKIRKKIEAIEAEGWSKMHTALLHVHKIAKKSRKEGRLVRIILFTDGQPTDTKDVGDYEDVSTLLLANRVPVDTVGLGPKHAVELLALIAEMTTGKYCYAEHSGYLPEIVDELTEAAATSIAPNPTLVIELTNPEDESSDLYQYEPTKGILYKFEKSGQRLEAPIRAIEAGKAFRACVRLLCNNPSKGAAAPQQRICSISLVEGGTEHFKQDILVDIVAGQNEINRGVNQVFEMAAELRKHRVDVTQRGDVGTLIQDFGQETQRG